MKPNFFSSQLPTFCRICSFKMWNFLLVSEPGAIKRFTVALRIISQRNRRQTNQSSPLGGGCGLRGMLLSLFTSRNWSNGGSHRSLPPMLFTFKINKAPGFKTVGKKRDAKNENTDGGERTIPRPSSAFSGFQEFKKNASSHVYTDGLRLVSWKWKERKKMTVIPLEEWNDVSDGRRRRRRERAEEREQS